MGRSEKRELISRLKVLLVHLLKWRFQPAGRGNSWRLTIAEQRRDVAEHLNDNPSLRTRLAEAMDSACGGAVLAAARETNLGPATFPETCPWDYAAIMDPGSWPGGRRRPGRHCRGPAESNRPSPGHTGSQRSWNSSHWTRMLSRNAGRLPSGRFAPR